ncbi:MAG TPA: DUF3592 domain-containing protein [Feifaniaceae bacterium]|nr:DUF3592 domain-containing protein [Feifaniaceae bacterium]
MDQTTAAMTLLGGLYLLISALRLIIQKRRIVKNGENVRAKVSGFEGKHTVYRFMRGDKSITARSLQRTRYDGKRLNTMENIYFNPETPQRVVIAHSGSIEWNAALMAVFGVIAAGYGCFALFA